MFFSLVTPGDPPSPGHHDHTGDESQRDPFRDWKVGTLMMTLLLTSLGILFAASIAIYLIMSSRAETWPPPGAPTLPSTMWLSTLLILAGSVSIQLALSAIRSGSQALMRFMLVITVLLALGFLSSQVSVWFQMDTVDMSLPPKGQVAAFETSPKIQVRYYVMLFWYLAILHAAHVAGGLISLGITTTWAFMGRYTPTYHPGLSYSTMYWHFLGAVWVVVFGVVYLF